MVPRTDAGSSILIHKPPKKVGQNERESPDGQKYTEKPRRHLWVKKWLSNRNHRPTHPRDYALFPRRNPPAATQQFSTSSTIPGHPGESVRHARVVMSFDEPAHRRACKRHLFLWSSSESSFLIPDPTDQDATVWTSLREVQLPNSPVRHGPQRTSEPRFQSPDPTDGIVKQCNRSCTTNTPSPAWIVRRTGSDTPRLHIRKATLRTRSAVAP